MSDESWSGGCQCGAVRYELLERPSNPCICHCPWLLEAMHVPATQTGEGDNGSGDTPERFAKIKASNHQHPDHET